MPKGLQGFQKGELNTKTSQYKKGHKHSPETIKKFSNSLKGRKAWNEGLKGCNSGDKNPNWKGGITPINRRLRGNINFKIWKKAVLERDNFTCQKSGQRGGSLVVHHINNFQEFPELRFAVDNGITLSNEKHLEFHKKYGFKNNTLEQLEEFIIKGG